MGFLTIAGGFARGAQGALEADRAQEANIELENIRQRGHMERALQTTKATNKSKTLANTIKGLTTKLENAVKGVPNMSPERLKEIDDLTYQVIDPNFDPNSPEGQETMSSVNKQYSLTQKVLSEQAQMGTIQAQIAQHDPNVGKKFVATNNTGTPYAFSISKASAIFLKQIEFEHGRSVTANDPPSQSTRFIASTKAFEDTLGNLMKLTNITSDRNTMNRMLNYAEEQVKYMFDRYSEQYAGSKSAGLIDDANLSSYSPSERIAKAIEDLKVFQENFKGHSSIGPNDKKNIVNKLPSVLTKFEQLLIDVERKEKELKNIPLDARGKAVREGESSPIASRTYFEKVLKNTSSFTAPSSTALSDEKGVYNKNTNSIQYPPEQLPRAFAEYIENPSSEKNKNRFAKRIVHTNTKDNRALKDISESSTIFENVAQALIDANPLTTTKNVFYFVNGKQYSTTDAKKPLTETGEIVNAATKQTKDAAVKLHMAANGDANRVLQVIDAILTSIQQVGTQKVNPTDAKYLVMRSNLLNTKKLGDNLSEEQLKNLANNPSYVNEIDTLLKTSFNSLKILRSDPDSFLDAESQDSATRELTNRIMRNGLETLTPLPQATSKFIDLVSSNFQGLVDLVKNLTTQDSVENFQETDTLVLKQIVNPETRKFATELIGNQREAIAANLEISKNSEKSNAERFIAYNRAKLGFLKINLAYQYAVSSQGGQGGGSRVSDADFRFNFEGLFEKAGPTQFLGVLDHIRTYAQTQKQFSKAAIKLAQRGYESVFVPNLRELASRVAKERTIRLTNSRRPVNEEEIVDESDNRESAASTTDPNIDTSVIKLAGDNANWYKGNTPADAQLVKNPFFLNEPVVLNNSKDAVIFTSPTSANIITNLVHNTLFNVDLAKRNALLFAFTNKGSTIQIPGKNANGPIDTISKVNKSMKYITEAIFNGHSIYNASDGKIRTSDRAIIDPLRSILANIQISTPEEVSKDNVNFLTGSQKQSLLNLVNYWKDEDSPKRLSKKITLNSGEEISMLDALTTKGLVSRNIVEENGARLSFNILTLLRDSIVQTIIGKLNFRGQKTNERVN